MVTLTQDQAVDQLTAFVVSAYKGERYTAEEFQQLKTILEENKKHFIFEPDGGMAGFSINVYSHPSYPDTPPLKITRISGNWLPEELRIEERIAPGRRLDDGMRELSPFSHSEENAKLLTKYRLEQPHDLGYYEY
jgi:hypothetical protein